MIRYYIGKPRSGKSYALVKSIHDNFMNPKSRDFKKHKFLYTNIAGFKHELLNGHMLDHPLEDPDHKDGFVYKRSIPLKFNDLYKHLEEIYRIGDNDQELVEYCKANRLYNAHFCIDECHMHFNKEDPVLVWWLGYHGHMGQDISFVTQNLRKVHEKYKLDCESFLEAQPKSKAVSHKQLRYIEFASDQLTDKQKVRSYSILMKDQIHDLYKSGDIHKPKSITLPLFGFVGLSFIAMIFFFKLLFTNVSPDQEIPIKQDSPGQITNVNNSPGTTKQINENEIVLFISCNSNECQNNDDQYIPNQYPFSYTHSMLKLYGKFLTVVSTKNLTMEYKGKTELIETYRTLAFKIEDQTAKKIFPEFFRRSPENFTDQEEDNTGSITDSLKKDTGGSPAGVAEGDTA